MSVSPNKVRLQISLTRRVNDDVRAYCKSHNMTLSMFLELAARRFLKVVNEHV